MLDIRFIRENVELVRKAVKDKKESVDIDKLLQIDEKRRGIIAEVDSMRAERNLLSSQIGELMKTDRSQAMKIKDKAKELSDRIKTLEEDEKGIAIQFDEVLQWVPNIPDDDVPEGKGENDNVTLKIWKNPPEFDFVPKDHTELAESLDILDFKRGAKIAGSSFPLYKGLGAKLERALINFMIDFHTQNNGYTEIFPPFLANTESMFATGQIPKLESDMYNLTNDNLYLIPTGEVPLTNIRRGETIDESELPIKYVAYTPCFRREAGSYGKETKGLIRVHQFNKVEMVKITSKEESAAELEKLLHNAESILQALGIHYRVIELCRGDLSFSAAKCYDIEVWSPALNKFLETSSCSNFKDFQARRSGIKIRRRGGKVELAHTLNGSGVATSRLMISILESYQTKNGSIEIPPVLFPYMNDLKEISLLK